MMKRTILLLALFCSSFPGAERLAGQGGTLESNCERPEVTALGAQETCLSAAQAVASAQPLLGMLIAGGNPTLGSAGTAGLRLGFLPRVSAGVRFAVVPIRVPDILADEIPGQIGAVARKHGFPAPAVAGDLSVAVLPGVSLAPGFGRIGGLSVLGSLAYLPFNLFDSNGFGTSELAYGLGARFHLFEESFFVPGVSLSLMRRSLPQLAFGDICPGGVTFQPISDSEEIAVCASDGDLGEFSADLVDWSTRIVASKKVLGMGVSVGAGHDRYRSDVGIGFRGSQPIPGSDLTPVFRISDQKLTSTRWTLFGNLSYTLLVGSVGVEAGWQQGDAPLRGFDELESNLDPRDGSWYGSIGARLAL